MVPCMHLVCVCVHKRCYSAEILYFQTVKSYYQTCMCTVCTTGWITSKATTVCMYMYMCIASFIDCTLGSLSGDLGLWVWLWLLLVPVRVKCWMVCTWKKRWSRFHQLCPHSACPMDNIRNDVTRQYGAHTGGTLSSLCIASMGNRTICFRV